LALMRSCALLEVEWCFSCDTFVQSTLKIYGFSNLSATNQSFFSPPIFKCPTVRHCTLGKLNGSQRNFCEKSIIDYSRRWCRHPSLSTDKATCCLCHWQASTAASLIFLLVNCINSENIQNICLTCSTRFRLIAAIARTYNFPWLQRWLCEVLLPNKRQKTLIGFAKVRQMQSANISGSWRRER